MPPKPTHLLLDFFGTVVEYSPSRTAQGYERTHDLTTRMGSTLTYDESRAAWSTHHEYRPGRDSATREEARNSSGVTARVLSLRASTNSLMSRPSAVAGAVGR